MDAKETIIAIAYFAVPVLSFVLFYFYSKREERKHTISKHYELGIFNKKLIISSLRSKQLFFLAIIYLWFDFLLPMSFSVIIVSISALSLSFIKINEKKPVEDETRNILGKLSSLDSIVIEVSDHIKSLEQNVSNRQLELNEKERIKKELDKIIEDKNDEVNTLSNMTTKEKDLLIDAVADATKKNNNKTFWWGLALGFVINLLATLTWTLLGNPGKEDIMKKFQEFISNIKNIA